jgi:hypothetical protein
LTFVSVQAELRVAANSHPAVAKQVQRRAEAEMYAFLNPYVGGPAREGWPFGRDLHLSEIYGLLQRIPEVEYVESVKLEIVESGSAGARPAPPRVTLSRHGLICSAKHVITVERSGQYEVAGGV